MPNVGFPVVVFSMNRLLSRFSMFRTLPLQQALTEALEQGVSITDEASAFEWKGASPALVAGRSDNFKVTQPEDLALAEFYLSQNKE